MDRLDRSWGKVDQAGAAAWQTLEGAARELAEVLAAVRRHRVATRATVLAETGLGRAAVAHRLDQLRGAGLIGESGTERSSGGRPPRQLRFEQAAGHVLVADLGATSIDVALADLAGAVVAHRAEPADIAAGPADVLGRVEHLFDEMSREPGLPLGELWGIAVGLPGPVEFVTGRLISPPIMPGWDGYAVRERLSDRYGVPVWVDNDVNVMALGEWREGVARGHRNVVFVKIGSGVGAGLISEGLLHRGAQGSAGDVGHIQVVDDPDLVCRCGKVGCLEAVAGGAALGRAAERAAREGRSPLLAAWLAERGALAAEDVGAAAGRGDPTSLGLLQRAGRMVGHMLATVVNILNPSLIVIGGGVAETGDVLLAAVREVIYGRSLPLATRHLLIQRSALGSRAGVVGAAAMVLDELFAPQRLARWLEDGPAAPGGVIGAGHR